MNSRTRSRSPASIGSNQSSRRWTAVSACDCRVGEFMLLLVMAWSPPALKAGIVWVSAPGDYATFNSNHTPDGTYYDWVCRLVFRPIQKIHLATADQCSRQKSCHTGEACPW